jgi:hypothetical protein
LREAVDLARSENMPTEVDHVCDALSYLATGNVKG